MDTKPLSRDEAVRLLQAAESEIRMLGVARNRIPALHRQVPSLLEE